MSAAVGARAYARPTTDTDRLVRDHMDLVKRIANHMLGRLPSTVQLDDLIQAGLVGLLEAATKFDPTLGASFETYAGIRIRGAMVDEFRKGDWTPRSVHRKARDVAATMRQLENKLAREPADNEVADALGIDIAEYHDLLNDVSGARLFSFEELTEDFLDDSTSPVIGQRSGDPYEEVQRQSFFERLVEEIEALSEKEQLVLSLYYEEGLNLKEIGAVLDVSESRISQIRGKIVARLASRLQETK